MKQKLISLISLIVSIFMMNFSLGTAAYADGHLPESKEPSLELAKNGQGFQEAYPPQGRAGFGGTPYRSR